MFGGISVRGRLLVLSHAAVRAEVLVYALDERRLKNSFCISEDPKADAGAVVLSEDSRVFVADSRNCCVHVHSVFGQWLGNIGQPPGASRPRDRRGLPSYPKALCLDSRERLWISCGDRPRVHGLQVFSLAGKYLMSPHSFGERTKTFSSPLGLCRIEEQIWVADTGADRLQRFSEEGQFIGSHELGFEVGRPLALAPYLDGIAVICQTPKLVIRCYDRHMKESKCLRLPKGESFVASSGLAGYGKGELLVLDRDGERVLRFDGKGLFVEVLLDLREEGYLGEA